MEIWKSLSLICLVICWLCNNGGYCEASGGGETLPCIQKLLPCEAYLKGPAAPSAACCVPLKEMVVSDTQCLCAVFNNQAILKTFNVTQADALNLTKTCGSNADISICSKDTAPSGSPSIPAAPSKNGPETKTNNNAGITHVGGSGSLLSAFILSFIVSIF